MVSTRRKKADGGSASDNFNSHTNISINNENVEGLELEEKGTGGGGPGYEEFREQRIKENKERMKKLGIFDLSLRLKSQSRPNKKALRNVSTQKKPQDPLTLSASPRRSSRYYVFLLDFFFPWFRRSGLGDKTKEWFSNVVKRGKRKENVDT